MRKQHEFNDPINKKPGMIHFYLGRSNSLEVVGPEERTWIQKTDESREKERTRDIGLCALTVDQDASLFWGCNSDEQKYLAEKHQKPSEQEGNQTGSEAEWWDEITARVLAKRRG